VPTSVPPLFGFFPAGHWKMGCPDENERWRHEVLIFTVPDQRGTIKKAVSGVRILNYELVL
jgi:hypothetical protein